VCTGGAENGKDAGKRSNYERKSAKDTNYKARRVALAAVEIFLNKTAAGAVHFQIRTSASLAREQKFFSGIK